MFTIFNHVREHELTKMRLSAVVHDPDLTITRRGILSYIDRIHEALQKGKIKDADAFLYDLQNWIIYAAHVGGDR